MKISTHRTSLFLGQALLVFGVLSCRGPAGNAPSEQRRAALDFGAGDIQGTLTWHGAPASTADPRTRFYVLAGPNVRLTAPVTNGVYHLSNLTSGDHTLRVLARCCNYDDSQRLAERTVTVSVGATTTADFDVTSSLGKMSGSLTLNGAAPSGWIVGSVSGSAYVGIDDTGEILFPDATGRFSALFRPGTYSARVLYSGNTLATFTFTAMASASTNVGTIDLPAGSVQGTVRWNGAPVLQQISTGLRGVHGETDIGQSWGSEVGPDGHYFQQNVMPGTYDSLVFTSCADPVADRSVTINQGATTTANFDLTGDTGKVVGSVTVNGAPVPDVDVSFGRTGCAGPFAVPDAMGAFASPPTLTPGSWRASFRVRGLLLGRVDFTITAGATTNLGPQDFTATLPDPVSAAQGHVTWNGVDVSGSTGLYASGQSAGGAHWEAPLDAVGDYVSGEIIPGSYTASVGMLGFDAGGFPYDCSPALVSRTVSIPPGTTVTEDFDIGASVGRVIGAITINGATVPGASVVVNTCGVPLAPDGSFVLYMAPGTYTATVIADAGLALGGFDFDVAADKTTFLDGAPLGTPCAAGGECASGHCVDGVCCDNACGGSNANDCQACSAAAGASADGTCTSRAAGAACASDGNVCTLDQCDGTSTICQHPAGNAGAVCHDSQGTCDVAEHCDGTSTACPSDTLVASGTVCATGSLCENPGQCGGGPTCPGTTPIAGCVAQSAPACSGSCDVDLRGGKDVADGITVTFQDGIASPGGEVSVTPCSPGASPATGFKIVVGSSGQYCFDIDTSFAIPEGASILVCIRYPASIAANEASFQMMHDDGSGSGFLMNTADRCLTNGFQDAAGTIPCTDGLLPGTICGFASSLSPFAIVEPIDVTGPVFSPPPADITAYATSTSGAVVNYPLPAAVDDFDGPRPVACTPASGTQFAPGKKTVLCTTSDTHGNTSTASFVVWVQYQAPADGAFFLPPIDADGGSRFNRGSTIPVKFKLLGASVGIKNLVARLSVAKVTNGVAGPYVAADSTPPCDGTFRYDAGSKQYIFNLSTKQMTAGKWSLRTVLGDQVNHTVGVSLK